MQAAYDGKMQATCIRSGALRNVDSKKDSSDCSMVDTVGGFTFWTSLSLSPKTNMTPEFRSQSEVRISWVKTGAK